MPGIPAAQLVTEIKQAERQAVTTERGQVATDFGEWVFCGHPMALPQKGFP